MTQTQHEVQLIRTNGTIGTATATGNNAAWTCDCGMLLVGYSDAIDSTRRSSLVVCPACDRTYRVVAPYQKGKVTQVREVERAA